MSSDDRWVSAELREALARGDLPALAEAGLLKQQDLEYLLSFKRSIEDAEDTDRYQELLMQAVSKKVDKAVEHGNLSVMSHANGVTGGNKSVPMADWNKYEQIKDLYRQEPTFNTEFTNSIFQCIIFSSRVPPTGRGKSNTMYTLVEIGQTVFPDLRVMSNNTSDPFETVSEQWADIEQSIRDYDGWQILLIDEAAQFLQYADQGAGKTVSQMLKLLRHNHCHLIMVGHTGMDIPKDIRRQVFVLDKTSQKQGVLGYGITSGGSGDTMQVAQEVLRLNSIPATGVEYDDIDDEGIEIKFDGGENDDEAGMDEKPECWAISKRSGNVCGNDAVTPEEDPVLCVNHRRADVGDARERREESED